jgi:trehalose/maltose hydrolase-like predicted phosphorylase
VELPDDPAAQKALRFALFHLWNHTGRHDELALGARGLTGGGYAGHVFWDSDVYVMPALATMDPASARAMVLYRLNRLRAALAQAEASGREGARFPWESASDGYDVTPTEGFLGGRRVPVLTGPLEEHITADVAWAADYYATWTGDGAFVTGLARPLVVEAARYWASRCRVDERGLAHIDRVIGPDEYHQSVDDNAFTNVMARWNLSRAAEIVEADCGATPETERWRALSHQLVDNLDRASGRYEQFSGYGELEPLVAAELADVPFAGDVLLGPERVARSQLIKQPDVLMLHFMLPDEVASGSLQPNLDFYLPRTVHGSSLSPAVSACLLARAGRPDEAYDLFRVALELDLHDETGLTASGLHLATLGGVWQAMLRGFLGVRVRAGGLELDPQLPVRWQRAAVRFGCLGRWVRIGVAPEEVVVETDRPLEVALAGARAQVVDGRAVMARKG